MTLMTKIPRRRRRAGAVRRRRARRSGADLRSGRQVRQILQRGRLQRRAALGGRDRRQLPRHRAAVRSPARTGAAPLRRGRHEPGRHDRLLDVATRRQRRAATTPTPSSSSSTALSTREHPNVLSILFNEHEGSYLVGMLAAMASEIGTVGFVGGMDIPLIRKFACGYAQGVKAVNPDATVIANMTGTTPAAWNDPVKGSRADQGADQPGRRRDLSPPPAAPAWACCRPPPTRASCRSASTATRTTCTPARS